MAENIVIFYNDGIDSDNMAGALALMRAMQKEPNTRVIWILEPRLVSLGLAATAEQQSQCQALIERHFPTRGRPFKVLLGGLLEDSDVAGIKGLTKNEQELLQLAVKPEYGPKKDAELHSRLVAWDQTTCFVHWSQSPVDFFIDYDSLDEMHNPVNLNFHHHEELVPRSQEELRSYERILKEPLERRVESLRGWYDSCIERAERRRENQGSSVRPLDFDALCNTIEAAKSVRFFGGSSLRILQRFIERGVAHKLQCHLQVGSCDLASNLFPNQFNIALNPSAAKFVLHRFTEFSKFAVVPSHSVQNTKYSLAGLTREGGQCLAKRILGFNCRQDALRIATKQVTLEKDYPDKHATMPDLSAFLCAIIPGYMGSALGYATVEDLDGTLLFKQSSSGIPMYDLSENKSLGEAEVVELFASIVGAGG